MTRREPKKLPTLRTSEGGFTLIETMVAMLVLVIGVLGVAAMLGNALAYMNNSKAEYIAQQKAAEAVESIFTARDIGQATWNTICNSGSSVCCAGSANCTPAGIFQNGFEPLCGPGTDGIIDTSDDFNGSSCAGGTLAQPDGIILPNASGTVNAASGVIIPLTSFKRQVVISTVLDSNGNTIANLRQITVTVTYSVGRFTGLSYTLNTYISNFS